MKNIHLIETDKPSRLYKSKITQNLFISDVLSFSCDGTYNQHLYITSNEVIKEGWYFNNAIGVNKCVFVEDKDIKGLKNLYGNKPRHLEKIILTTDENLINNGVQSIDDEFLNWFIKNPTCEEVKVADYGNILFDDKVFHMYKIVIPKKEEPNPFELPEVLPDDVFYESLDDSCIKELGQKVGHSVQVEDDLTDDEWLIKEKHKETLEEVAKELYPIEYTRRMFMINRMAQQTSVEWLVEQLMERDFIEKNHEIIEQAKQMEKDQSQRYAEFCIKCDRNKIRLLDFNEFINL